MTRPELSASLSSRDFLDFYWLKSELLAFCKASHLPTSGSKTELTQRIVYFLETGKILASKPVQDNSRAAMPTAFTRESVIGEGWRCSQELRTFFEKETNRKFHFNGFMRDYITQNGIGHTLEEAIEGWYESKRKPAGSGEIAKQFKYNRHMRAFHLANPEASHEDAIESWKEKRSRRASES